MVKIEKSEVIQRCIDGLRLNQAEINGANTDFIKPVFITNEIGKTKFLNWDSIATNTYTITVPTGKKWVIHLGYCKYTASANVGNRILRFQLIPASPLAYSMWDFQATTAITAGQTRWNVLNNNSPDYSIVSVTGVFPIPNQTILLENQRISFYDSNNIDAAGDSMMIRLLITEYSTDA